jgi:hypothetical protein
MANIFDEVKIPGAENNRAQLDAIVKSSVGSLSKDKEGNYIHNTANYEKAKEAVMKLGFRAGDAARWLTPKEDKHTPAKKTNVPFKSSIMP